MEMIDENWEEVWLELLNNYHVIFKFAKKTYLIVSNIHYFDDDIGDLDIYTIVELNRLKSFISIDLDYEKYYPDPDVEIIIEKLSKQRDWYYLPEDIKIKRSKKTMFTWGDDDD